jgi:hypothetical protein
VSPYQNEYNIRWPVIDGEETNFENHRCSNQETTNDQIQHIIEDVMDQPENIQYLEDVNKPVDPHFQARHSHELRNFCFFFGNNVKHKYRQQLAHNQEESQRALQNNQQN